VKIITRSEGTKMAQELLDTIGVVLAYLGCMTIDLEHEFGDDVLTKKIGEEIRFAGGQDKFSLRDRYGSICDRLLNTSLSIAQSLGVGGREFRMAIDEVVGDSRIYNGEYDQYIAISIHSDVLPDESEFEKRRGLKRWWKPFS